MRGEYGFLSEFDNINEEEARRRVRRMSILFNIKEFEFYNAFEGYSKPPGMDKESWHCVCFDTPVRRAILRAYTEEIAALGGRSWLSVVAMGTDPGDAEAQEGAELLGQQYVQGKVLLDVVRPTARLAERMAPRWAEFAGELGFSGIHWATVNEYIGDGDGQHIRRFLRTAAPVLQAHGLGQTWGFADGFGWEPALLDEGTVAFPVWQVLDSTLDPFSAMRSGVVKQFPGTRTDSRSETPTDFLERQWAKARCSGLSYLAIGDGSRALRSDYYPGARELSGADIDEMRHRVFTEPECGATDDQQPRESGELTTYVEGAGLDARAFRGQRAAFGEALAGAYGYESCRAVEVREISRPVSNGIRVLARPMETQSLGLVISFSGDCAGGCQSHDSVTAEHLKEAVQGALEGWRKGTPIRVLSAEVRWPDRTAAVSRTLKVDAGTDQDFWPRAAFWATPLAAAALCGCLLALRTDVTRRTQTAASGREVQDAYTRDAASLQVQGSQAAVSASPGFGKTNGQSVPEVVRQPQSFADLRRGKEAEALDPVHVRLLSEKTTIV